MSGFTVFLKKELMEQIRTYKLLIVVGVFIILGLTAPLMTKFLPDLAQASGGEMVIQFPTPTPRLAIRQYIQSLTQTGLLVAILVSMGLIARERERGTAILTLSKPVNRWAFVLAKLTAVTFSFGVALAGAALSCYTYTRLLFGDFDLFTFFMVNLLIGLFLLLCIAVTLLFSAVFKNQLAAGCIALISLVGQSVVSGLPTLGRYTAGEVVSWANRLLEGKNVASWGAVAVTMVLIALSLLLAGRIFQGKEL